MMLRNLALAYVETGNSAAAEPVAGRALSIFESRFGSSDGGLSPILNVLAECYASTGRLELAQQATERVLSMGREAGVHYGTALQNLGALRELSGDYKGAAQWYTRAIAVKAEMLGAAHPYVALSKNALRRVQRQDRLALAKRVHLELATD
jgi:tetratricopeptide (TPR) repeat protein